MYFSISNYAQEAGKIYSSQEAAIQFGEVLEATQFPTSTVRYWLKQTENAIMFKYVDGEIIVLGDSRELLYSTKEFTDTDEIFHMFSTVKLTELLDKGAGSATYIENREKVLSISNGNFTLENSWPCPPYCD
jgi:hypothetical protein